MYIVYVILNQGNKIKLLKMWRFIFFIYVRYLFQTFFYYFYWQLNFKYHRFIFYSTHI